jgi:hypothetical protein
MRQPGRNSPGVDAPQAFGFPADQRSLPIRFYLRCVQTVRSVCSGAIRRGSRFGHGGPFGLSGQQPVGEAGERCADDRRYPEQPELCQGPTAHEQRGTGAAGGVHRRVRDGDADQVNQRKREANGDGCEALRGAGIRRTENNEQEEKGVSVQLPQFDGPAASLPRRQRRATTAV